MAGPDEKKKLDERFIPRRFAWEIKNSEKRPFLPSSPAYAVPAGLGRVPHSLPPLSGGAGKIDGHLRGGSREDDYIFDI